MDELRSWVITLCACAAAVSIAESLLPEGSVKKAAYFVLSLVAASCLMSPISAIRDISFEFEDIGGASYAEDWLMRETSEEFAKNTAELLKTELIKMNAEPKKISVMTDIAEDGSVYIDKARITLGRECASRLDEIESELYDRFGITADINIE